jgi:hypothetical protein
MLNTELIVDSGFVGQGRIARAGGSFIIRARPERRRNELFHLPARVGERKKPAHSRVRNGTQEAGSGVERVAVR